MNRSKVLTTDRFYWVSALLCGALLVSCSSPPNTSFTTDIGGMDTPRMDVTCNGDQTTCRGQCVDLRDSPSHCGACSNACPSGQLCVSGRCSTSCPSSQSRCGTLCATLDTDRLNCGMCGNACPAGELCAMGRCGVSCGSSYARCEDGPSADAGTDAGRRRGPYCTDTQTDERNCGGCGSLCALGSVCESGACVLRCPLGQSECSGRCVTFATDNLHCGGCGMPCTGRARCASGVCTTAACAGGTTPCGGQCIDLQYDNNNCGMCGGLCAAPSFCRMGTCTVECRTGTTLCNGRCVELMIDRQNCGMCANACPTGQVCNAGACSLVCPSGTTVCAGRCVDTTVDRVNCGRCGASCTASQLCTGGSCAPSCAAEQTNCAGVCVNTGVDSNHCGGCGVTCGAGYACGGGFCRPLVGTDVVGCTSPSQMCGAVCTDLRNDNVNCGSCGRVCTADRVCAAGMCSAPCFSGQTRCGAVCTDIRGDRLNCGACGAPCAMGLVCGGGRCVSDPTFRVTELSTMNCRTVEHRLVTGDDHGGIALSSTRLFYSGDGTAFPRVTTTGRFNADDLSMGTAVGSLEGLSGDLLNENVYVVQNALGQGPEAAGGGIFLATQLGVVNGDTGALSGVTIRLSTSLIMANNYGLFAGYGRMLVHTGVGGGVTSQWFSVQLPSGVVTALTVSVPPVHTLCEVPGYWGIAEFFGGEHYAVYVQNRNSIVRYRVRDGMITPVGTFSNLSDMCSITFSTSRNRWYFHHQGLSQFASGTEIVGFCDGRFESP